MKSVVEEVNQVSKDIPWWEEFIIFAISMALGFLIVSGALVYFINCLIFVDYITLIAYGIAGLVVIFVTLTTLFYLLGITKGKVKGIWKIVLTAMIITTFVAEIVLITLFALGVL